MNARWTETAGGSVWFIGMDCPQFASMNRPETVNPPTAIPVIPALTHVIPAKAGIQPPASDTHP